MQKPEPKFFSGHNHPVEGRVIVLHCRADDVISDTPMFAFGPFPSVERAIEWHATFKDDDDCFKVIVDIFDPWEVLMGDLINAARRN